MKHSNRAIIFMLTMLLSVFIMGMTALASSGPVPTPAPVNNTPSGSPPPPLKEGAGGAKSPAEEAYLNALLEGLTAAKQDGTPVKMIALWDVGIVDAVKLTAIGADTAAYLQSLGFSAAQSSQALASAQLLKAADFRLTGSATLTVDIPGYTPGHVLIAFHQDADGKITIYPLALRADGKFDMYGASFSPVVFVQYAVAGTFVSPKTERSFPVALICVAAVACVGTGFFAVKGKKTK